MRSRWKNSYVSSVLYNSVVHGDSNNDIKKKNIFLFDKLASFSSKSTCILPFFFHKILWVHDGRKYRSLYIKPSMFGHKLGDYVTTRVRCVYKRKKKKKKQKKKSKK